MEITAEVSKAFNILIENAGNDFEMYRITKLFQDLTNPPRVEVIDDKYQSFNGVKFRKRKGGHYFTPMYSIYRSVWQYYYGEVPPHTIIHHIDQNKDNNNIENLIPMAPSEHQKLHAALNQRNHIAPIRDLICERCGKVYQARYSGRNKFCPDCRKIIKSTPNPAKNFSKTCLWCGKEFFTSSKQTETCSHHCKNRLVYFRKTGKVRAEKLKTCAVCGKEFVVSTAHNNVTNRKTCSDGCFKFLQQQTLVKLAESHRPPTDLTCAVCGKIFHSKHLSTKTCSPECTKILLSLQNKGKNAKPTIKATCPICGKEFEFKSYHQKKYCSPECVKKARHAPRKKYKKKFSTPRESVLAHSVHFSTGA